MSFIVREQIDVAHNCDFLFTSHGSLALLQPLSMAAEEWAGEHLVNDETQFWGSAIAIEQRYVGDILVALADDGLVVSSHRNTIH